MYEHEYCEITPSYKNVLNLINILFQRKDNEFKSYEEFIKYFNEKNTLEGEIINTEQGIDMKLNNEVNLHLSYGHAVYDISKKIDVSTSKFEINTYNDDSDEINAKLLYLLCKNNKKNYKIINLNFDNNINIIDYITDSSEDIDLLDYILDIFQYTFNTIQYILESDNRIEIDFVNKSIKITDFVNNAIKIEDNINKFLDFAIQLNLNDTDDILLIEKIIFLLEGNNNLNKFIDKVKTDINIFNKLLQSYNNFNKTDIIDKIFKNIIESENFDLLSSFDTIQYILESDNIIINEFVNKAIKIEDNINKFLDFAIQLNFNETNNMLLIEKIILLLESNNNLDKFIDKFKTDINIFGKLLQSFKKINLVIINNIYLNIVYSKDFDLLLKLYIISHIYGFLNDLPDDYFINKSNEDIAEFIILLNDNLFLDESYFEDDLEFYNALPELIQLKYILEATNKTDIYGTPDIKQDITQDIKQDIKQKLNKIHNNIIIMNLKFGYTQSKIINILYEKGLTDYLINLIDNHEYIIDILIDKTKKNVSDDVSINYDILIYICNKNEIYMNNILAFCKEKLQKLYDRKIIFILTYLKKLDVIFTYDLSSFKYNLRNLIYDDRYNITESLYNDTEYLEEFNNFIKKLEGNLDDKEVQNGGNINYYKKYLKYKQKYLKLKQSLN